jgi:hypothetical protein
MDTSIIKWLSKKLNIKIKKSFIVGIDIQGSNSLFLNSKFDQKYLSEI